MIAVKLKEAFGHIAPASRQAIFKGNIGQMARSIAFAEDKRVLIVTGRLDGPGGLPDGLAEHGHGLRLRALGAYTAVIPSAIFEIIDEDAMCAVVDELQSRGGYRTQVLNGNGDEDPHYSL